MNEIEKPHSFVADGGEDLEELLAETDVELDRQIRPTLKGSGASPEHYASAEAVPNDVNHLCPGCHNPRREDGTCQTEGCTAFVREADHAE